MAKQALETRIQYTVSSKRFDYFQYATTSPICRKIQCKLAPTPLCLLSPPRQASPNGCDSLVGSTYMASSLSNPATLICRTNSDNGVVISFVLVFIVFHTISYRSVSLPPLQALHHLLPSPYFLTSAHPDHHILTRSSSRRSCQILTGRLLVSMAVAFNNAKMREHLLQIINERDQLRVELRHAKSAIIELEGQTLEYDRLLSNALSQLQACQSKPIPTVAPKPSWIGTWQCSLHTPRLALIETAWANGWLQKALSQMPAMVDRNDLGPHHFINSRLLYSALLQSTGGDLRQALANAEEAITMAVDLGLQDLAAKGQFQRGLCYHYLGHFANARWCFVLASPIDENTKDCRQEAEDNLQELPEGHPQRSVSADFKFYCDVKIDDFICGV